MKPLNRSRSPATRRSRNPAASPMRSRMPSGSASIVRVIRVVAGPSGSNSDGAGVLGPLRALPGDATVGRLIDDLRGPLLALTADDDPPEERLVVALDHADDAVHEPRKRLELGPLVVRDPRPGPRHRCSVRPWTWRAPSCTAIRSVAGAHGRTGRASKDPSGPPSGLHVPRSAGRAMPLSRRSRASARACDGAHATLRRMTDTDGAQEARSAGLRYAHDDRPGITRRRAVGDSRIATATDGPSGTRRRSSGSAGWRSRPPGPTSGSAPTRTATSRRPAGTRADASSIATTRSGADVATTRSSPA